MASEARSVCAGCPVGQEGRDYARAGGMFMLGVRGGLGDGPGKLIRREAGKQPHPFVAPYSTATGQKCA